MSLAPYILETRADPVTNYTQAFSLPPSQVWDGNDGAWSTFVIRVGDPPQYFRVTPSTVAAEVWVPIPDSCDRGIAWCGNARGVEPFNSGTSGPASGSPDGVKLGMLNAGDTCTANKSPMCTSCVSVNGRCTTGPCTGRTCCGDPPGSCNSGGCNGISGICTGQYIGCPCPGADWNLGTGAGIPSAGAANPLLAQGFVSNVSTSWAGKGNKQVSVEAYLNSSATGEYGTDSVGIGSNAVSGLTVDGIVVAGVPTLPFYLGKLGMRPSNTSGPDGNAPSFMTQLKSQEKIPSLSYGWTSGALYKQQPVLGSLTFGGYDASRFVPNDMTFGIDKSGNLNVPIQSISANRTMSKNNSTLMTSNITAVIDTATPHTWLPLQVCQAFEKAFGLRWDDENRLYRVNDTIHQQLLNQNPQITFTLGMTADRTINITLPYAAFDLQASQPFYENGTNYFPIRRATTPNQYTLGRAFFQEAYLTADYDAGSFSIQQALYPPPANPDIITINHNPNAPSSSSQGAPSTNTGPALSRGAIAGIAVGAFVFIAALFALAFFLFRRHKLRCQQKTQQQPHTGPSKQPSMTFSSSTTRSGRFLDEKYGGSGSSASFHTRSNLSQRDRDRDRERWDHDRNHQLQHPRIGMGSPVDGVSPTHAGETTLIGSPLTHRNGHSPIDGAQAELDSPDGGKGFYSKGLSRDDSLHKPLPRPPQELHGSEAARELCMRDSTNSAPPERPARMSAEWDGPGSQVGHFGHMASRGSRKGSLTSGGGADRRSGETEGSGRGVPTGKRKPRHIYEMMA